MLASREADAQLTLGPGLQSGTSGQEAEFVFSIAGSSNASAFGFTMLSGSAPPYSPSVIDEAGKVDCTVEADLATSVQALAFALPGGRLSVSFGDFTFPIVAFGRDGIIGRCKVLIDADAASGVYPLSCADASASDPLGNPVATTCADGTLTIEGLPAGDCDCDAQTAIADLQQCIKIFLDPELLAACPACDVEADDVADIDDLQAVVNCFLDARSASCPRALPCRATSVEQR